MEPVLASVVSLAGLLVFLAMGFWVALALAGVGFMALTLFTGVPVGKVFATTVWGSISLWTLTALPLFIWMGEILFKTRLSEDMFRGLSPWLIRIPGRLLHFNILGCGLFAAISGSSAATAVTIGRMALPELRARGYDEHMSIGSLTGSATLGLMIPPSLMMIVYGVAADVSIADLFIAGIVPGLVIIVLFMGFLAVWASLHPDRMPPSEATVRLREKIVASKGLFPIVALMIFVLGSIYGGFATPTEAAACGVVGALLVARLTGSLTWGTFLDSLVAATRTSCMIIFILAGASFMSVAMGFTGVPQFLATWVGQLNLTPVGLLFGLAALYLLLGCFLDGISMIVLTTSVIMPIVKTAGIDLLWFGIYLVLVVEMAQITPPVGFNLFVIQSLTNRSILYIARAAIPFFLLLCLALGLIIAVPELVTWLPRQMR